MKKKFTFFTALIMLLFTTLNAQTITQLSNNRAKGPIAQAFSYMDGPLGDDVHIQFDVDDFSGTVTKKSNFATKLYAGEYYMGTWYASDDSYMLYAIDAETSEYSSISATDWVTEMAYDYSTNTMYGMKELDLYIINIYTGVYTNLGSLNGLPGDDKLLALAIDLNGNMYGVSSNEGIFYSVDKSTLQCTAIGNTGMQSYIVQSMGFDHNTGKLYWAHCGEFQEVNFKTSFCTIDVNTGVATVLAENTGLMSGFFIPYIPNIDVPNAPTNADIIPIGASLKAKLSWTNPTTTLAGNSLTSISKIVINRNGEIIKEFDNPIIGDNMTYTDETVPQGDIYYYNIYAVNEHGVGNFATVLTIIGDLCPIYLELFCSSSFGWEESNITVTQDDISYCTATLNYGERYRKIKVYIPSGITDFTYKISDYNDEKYFKIYNADDELIYDEPESPTGPTAGLFFTYENDCGGDIGIEKIETTTFKIYPNPVDDMLYIETEENINYATIYNLTGRIVKSTNVVNKTINVSNLSSGVYFIRFQTVKGEQTVKIVKQ